MTAHGLKLDLTRYRETESERLRTADLVDLIPAGAVEALDVGARDGHFSKVLTRYVERVTALDLETPVIAHPRIKCVKGDITALTFERDSFDLIVCTEVLEHIPSELLTRACSELTRVSRRHLLVGVPFKQDIRVGRTTCRACGAHNPPWGHINAFDEERLGSLFPGMSIERRSFVGRNDASTNFVSTFMMDIAGNPFGTYEQDEPCIRCGERLSGPPPRSMMKKGLSKAAFWASKLTLPPRPARPNWIHLLMRKAH